MEFGETLLQACNREIGEECGGAKFNFKKILYIRDFIKPEKNEHSVEVYILGDVDKFEELEGLKEAEFGDNHWQTWADLNKLENLDVRPKSLVKQIIGDYKHDFSGATKYLGEID
jgi:ADP-ribose pyrophosphatase YjhB (NUDIX family)